MKFNSVEEQEIIKDRIEDMLVSYHESTIGVRLDLEIQTTVNRIGVNFLMIMYFFSNTIATLKYFEDGLLGKFTLVISSIIMAINTVEAVKNGLTLRKKYKLKNHLMNSAEDFAIKELIKEGKLKED